MMLMSVPTLRVQQVHRLFNAQYHPLHGQRSYFMFLQLVRGEVQQVKIRVEMEMNIQMQLVARQAWMHFPIALHLRMQVQTQILAVAM